MTRGELVRRIESCLENAAREKDHGSPVYDPYDQWQACVEVLQDALRALAPAPAPDDEALIATVFHDTHGKGMQAREALRRRFAELRATSLKYQLAFGDRDNDAHRLADRVAELEAEIRRRDLAADMKRRADELTDSLLKGADT